MWTSCTIVQDETIFHLWDQIDERNLRKVIKEDLEIKGSIIIERAHRTGDVRKVIDNNRPGTIVANLLNYKDKTHILQKAKEKRLLEKYNYINEDYS